MWNLSRKGGIRAEYGDELIERLAADLSARHGRGFLGSQRLADEGVLPRMADSADCVCTIRRAREILQTVSAESPFSSIASSFPLPWSAYVRLLSVKNEHARRFYETEALRGGWSVRQLDRQINSQFYERTALSRNKAAMLSKGKRPCQKIVLTLRKKSRTRLCSNFSASRTSIPKQTWKRR
ncbi:MAG: DUF1016 N-terminal domain-containing protein [Desulfomicrobium escambiense]|nr:DUF1016 N-terminal domain-containing protein [Desulfomicrobium escambiense]